MNTRQKIGGASAPAITIEIAPGELFDRATILAIKARKITAKAVQRENILRQRANLAPYERTYLKRFPALRPLVRELAKANRTLWASEDAIRALSKKHDYGARFVKVAERIHSTNDERARLKRAINDACGSSLQEEKSYAS